MTSRKIAVITGASAGVGRATARAFAQAGFDVALLARGDAGLAGAAHDVEAAGGRALPIPTDVAHFEEVDAAATRVEDEWGPIDVWVNDAMTTVFAPSWDVKPADFARAVEVTFLGQVWGTTAALARMRPRDRGSIVNVGSALAFIGIPLQSAYCSSKFACRGFFESTRAELLHEGSHVSLSMVHLPAVNTPQFDWCETTLDHHPQPVPPIYQPEIPAKFILAAALDGRRAKVVGSWNKILVVAGRLFPGLGNQYAAIGAWDTQLTDQPISPDRPDNLYKPADETVDNGAHGIFDHKAGGFFDPSFLESLPTTARTFAVASARTAREKVRTYRAIAANTQGGMMNSTDPAEGKAPDDSLELLAEQDRVLVKVFDGWDAATPSPDVEDSRVLVKKGWERGTFGKLLIEHAAVRVAAKEDVARVLRDAGEAHLAEVLTARLRDVRTILDRLDEMARGVDPVGLAASVDFAGAVGELAALIRADLGTETATLLPAVAAALGDRRSRLASARHVESHAPTHPGPDQRWYDDIGPLARIHARYDRLRGFPWAESGPISDTDLASRYADPE